MATEGIRELAERHWNGEGDLAHEHHPVFPAAQKRAEEIADGVLYLKSVASITTIDTGDGLVMLDTGRPWDTEILYKQVRRWRSSARLSAAVFSHHHVDHVFGVGPFDQEAADQGVPRPRVYAHELVPEHFARYVKTLGWNSAINQRQFARPLDFSWPEEYRSPDQTYSDKITFSQGSMTFELHHARGETDDATWTWVPELRLVHPGDLFVYSVPNAGNPQKVQRYLSDWATALRKMAALGAEVMVAGHGLPIFGADRIRVALIDTAEVLDSIEGQTLALMNQGKSLDEVLHSVEMPRHLAGKPYLRPVYDHPQFLVRNVWRRYGGWYDGEPDNLLPAPRAQQAQEWVELSGGLERVLARATELSTAGDERMACHLVEFAVLAEPESPEAHALRASIYRARSNREESSMARNILGHAASSSEVGKRDLAGNY